MSSASPGCNVPREISGTELRSLNIYSAGSLRFPTISPLSFSKSALRLRQRIYSSSVALQRSLISLVNACFSPVRCATSFFRSSTWTSSFFLMPFFAFHMHFMDVLSGDPMPPLCNGETFSILRFPCERTEALSSAMRTSKNAIIIHMNGKCCLPPLWIKRSIAFGADILLGCYMLAGRKENKCGKDKHRNSNRPPRSIILPIKPIHLAGGQRKGKNYCQKNKSNLLHFHLSPLIKSVKAEITSLGKSTCVYIDEGSVVSILYPKWLMSSYTHMDTFAESEKRVDHRLRSSSKDCLSNLLLMISVFILALEIFFATSI